MSTESDVNTAATLAIGVAAAACSVVGPEGTAACAAGAAIAKAFISIGEAAAAGLRDTWHPSAAFAAGQLALAETLPSSMFANWDTLTLDGFHNAGNLIHPRTNTPAADAARSTRYNLLVAGIHKPSGPLYNPGDRSSRSNSYIESGTPDARWPLTDAKRTQAIVDLVRKHGNDLNAAQVLPLPRTKADAATLLAVLRSPHFRDSGVLDTDSARSVLPGLRRNAGRLMALAGESGSDPALSALLGGPVAAPARRDAKLGGVGDAEQPTSMVGYLVLGGTVVAGLFATWSLWAAYRSVNSPKPKR